MNKLIPVLFMLISSTVMAQETDTVFIKKLMEQHPDLFSAVLNHP